MEEWLLNEVRERSGRACEYCLVPQQAYPTVTFPVDHIIARQHGGPTRLGNLALSCLHCNSHKGPNIAGIDPATNKLSKLFNPRRHRWRKHFCYQGALLVGLTPVGRTTVAVLNMNAAEAADVRNELIREGTFPPAH